MCACLYERVRSRVRGDMRLSFGFECDLMFYLGFRGALRVQLLPWLRGVWPFRRAAYLAVRPVSVNVYDVCVCEYVYVCECVCIYTCVFHLICLCVVHA